MLEGARWATSRPAQTSPTRLSPAALPQHPPSLLLGSSGHEQTRPVLVLVGVGACKSSALGPQLDGWMPSQHSLLEIPSICHFFPTWKYSGTSFQVLHLHSQILQTLPGWRPESETTSHNHQTLPPDAFVVFSQSWAPRAQRTGRPLRQLIYSEGNSSHKAFTTPIQHFLCS